jgi:predicted ABC-type ATPase
VGLSNADLNVARVRARVARGGHDIPEHRIRERYASSLLNVIRLMPHLTELRVYDNSREADPHNGVPPKPELVLHLKQGKIVSSCKLTATPEWAKPIVFSALQIVAGRGEE